MRYVIFRDDDTNAFTPTTCLEELYRPFLDQGIPVNLATIPAVSNSAHMANGEPEGFLVARKRLGTGNMDSRSGGTQAFDRGTATATALCAEGEGAPEPSAENNGTVPLASNQRLVSYLKANDGFKIIQHGCHHDYLEFDRESPAEIASRLDTGTKLLQEAGFEKSLTFVAPYDKLSRPALREVAARFRVLSTGWYELGRLPYTWWPRYAVKKFRHTPHWRVGKTLLLTHPGCLLSCHRSYSTMLGGITRYLQTQQLTVLVTHWWEYFRNGEPDREFIDFLHETASYVATHPDLQAISFADLVDGRVQLN